MAIVYNAYRLIPIRTDSNGTYVPIVYRSSPGGAYYRWEGDATNYASYTIAGGQFSVHPQILNTSRAKVSGSWTENVYVENMATMIARASVGSGGIVVQKSSNGTVSTTNCSYSNNIMTPQFSAGHVQFSYDGYKMSSPTTGLFRATLQSGNPWNRSAGAQFYIHAYYLILTTGAVSFPTNPLVCNVNSRYGGAIVGDNDCTLESAATALNASNTLIVVKLNGYRAFLKSDNPYYSDFPYNRLQCNLQYVDMPRLKVNLNNNSSVSVLGCGMELWPYDYP